jgi:phosphate acetyltransferase
MDILKRIISLAKSKNASVVFAEGDEERTLEAAVKLAKDGVCKSFVVAKNTGLIEETAKRKSLDTSWVTILTPSVELLDQERYSKFIKAKVAKGGALQEAEQLALDPLYFSALFVDSGKAEAGIAGARSDTANVIKAALHCVGMSPDIKLISSFFLMIPPENHPVFTMPVLYSDCAVNPAPGALALKDIAVATVQTFKRIFPGETAREVFLSFSTMGSAKHPVLDKIKEAVKETKVFFENDQLVKIDGEMQFDAAVMPEISKRKAPGSPIEGKANIFIFPDLNSANIAYKLTERLAGFKALGPVLQGLGKPFSDLSRGCSVEDIYNITAVTLLGAKNNNN